MITLDFTAFLKLPWYGQVFTLTLDALGIITAAYLIVAICKEVDENIKEAWHIWKS